MPNFWPRHSPKSLDKLPGPTRELVENGAISTARFTVPDLTPTELGHELASLYRQLAIVQRAIGQAETLLNATPKP